MNPNEKYLRDEIITTEIRYISFIGEFNRYDLAFFTYTETPITKLFINLRNNHFAILGHANLCQNGEIENLLNVTEIEADELRHFLKEHL